MKIKNLKKIYQQKRFFKSILRSYSSLYSFGTAFDGQLGLGMEGIKN